MQAAPTHINNALTISNCYSTATLPTNAGGIIGTRGNFVNINNCFFDRQMAGVSHGVGSGDQNVGIIDITKNDLVVYPNPTTGMINVQCLMINVQNIEIFDVFGRTVVSRHATTLRPETSFDLSNVPSGIYFIRIQTDNGVVTKKVIKK